MAMLRPLSSTSSVHSLHVDGTSESGHSLNTNSPHKKLSRPRSSILAIIRAHARFLIFVFAAALFIAMVAFSGLEANMPSGVRFSNTIQSTTHPVVNSLNYTKVATILEPRMSPVLVPLLVSYLAIVPDDWPFVVWCSNENYLQLTRSAALSRQIQTGRLNITKLPSHVDIHSGEYLSRFLTKPWFYHQFHPDAEWMFFFQNDAVLCAASEQTVDDWLGYDWVGSPTLWTPGYGHGGNGGLGIRKISLMQRLTSDSTYRREDWHGETEADGVLHENAEDYWFMTAIERALGSDAMWPERDNRDQNEFSVVRNNLVLRPLGIHKGHGPMGLFGSDDIEEKPESSLNRLLRYCPEFSLVMDEENGRFN